MPYQKTNWQTGMVITREAMNRIENQLADLTTERDDARKSSTLGGNFTSTKERLDAAEEAMLDYIKDFKVNDGYLVPINGRDEEQDPLGPFAGGAALAMAREEVSNLKSAIGEVPTGKTVQAQISIISKKQALLHDNVSGTVQTYYFTDGSVSKIEHKAGNEIIRTDVYSYGTSTITETRTLNTGETLTIITNLNTLKTSVTYTTV